MTPLLLLMERSAEGSNDNVEGNREKTLPEMSVVSSHLCSRRVSVRQVGLLCENENWVYRPLRHALFNEEQLIYDIQHALSYANGTAYW